MEFQMISGTAIIGVICSIILSIGVPVALMIVNKKRYQAKISSFFIGAGTFLLFAMVLEQIMHILVIKVGGLNPESNRWLYYLYAALAAAVFEETGRIIAMRFWMKKNLNFPNALMYGIGHGGIEAILIGGLTGITNLISMVMINSGIMQQSLSTLQGDAYNQTVEGLSALWTTPAPMFFVSGIERVSAIILHIGLSLLIYKALKEKKYSIAALAYGIHFLVDFFAVASASSIAIWMLEVCVFVMALGTLVLALKLQEKGSSQET